MRVTCKHCGGAHPAFECRKKSTEPKNKPVANGVVPAARLDHTDSAVRAKRAVGTNSELVTRLDPRVTSGVSAPSRVRKKALAGELPSVNEQPETEGKLVQVQQSHSAPIMRTAADVDAFFAALPPPPKFDKKAWQREYMREYMRKRRAAK